MLSTYLVVNLYNSKKMRVCSNSNESMFQLQYPYIVNHMVFLPTIYRKNFSPWNPRATKSHKQYQKRIVQRFSRQTKEENFYFLSITLMANLNSQRSYDFNNNLRFIMEAVGYSAYLSLSVFSSSLFRSWPLNPQVRIRETHIQEEQQTLVIKEE